MHELKKFVRVVIAYADYLMAKLYYNHFFMIGALLFVVLFSFYLLIGETLRQDMVAMRQLWRPPFLLVSILIGRFQHSQNRFKNWIYWGCMFVIAQGFVLRIFMPEPNLSFSIVEILSYFGVLIHTDEDDEPPSKRKKRIKAKLEQTLQQRYRERTGSLAPQYYRRSRSIC